MVISHKYRYLFIEIPHTASTAISKELIANYAGEEILYKHANYSEFKHQAGEEEKRYFKFLAIRNPLDVVVTEYSKYRSNHRGVYTRPECWAKNGGWVLDSHLERFRFIEECDASFSTFFKKFYRSVYNNWFLLGHGEVDFVLRFERIGLDFQNVIRQIGIEPVRPLPTINASSRAREFSTYWDADTFAHASHVFGPFMKKWSYEMPGKWPRQRVSLIDDIRFKALDIPVNLAARFFTMSPYNPVLQNISNYLRKLHLTQ